MGWNEARITCVPDGWNLVVEEIDIQTMSGEAGRMVSTEKSLDESGIAVRADAIGHWLVSQGFLETERWKSGKNYRRDDLLVDVYNDNEEVSHFDLEFTLTRESPARWAAWQQFVTELCAAWPVALADWDARMRVGAESLFPLLQRTVAWKEFGSSFNWPTPESDQCS